MPRNLTAGCHFMAKLLNLGSEGLLCIKGGIAQMSVNFSLWLSTAQPLSLLLSWMEFSAGKRSEHANHRRG